MPFALLLALAAVAGGTLVTYLYDPDAQLPARLCAGVATGFAALGLVGFLLASLAGLTPVTLLVSGLVVGAPLALAARRDWRERVRADVRATARDLRRAVLRPGRGATAELAFYLAAALLFWLVFDRAMYETEAGVFTGVDNNIGDLPFHISVISGFAYGENFPPQHTEFAGVRLTYPFIIDFVAAMFVRAGATLGGALFWQNYALALALAGLLHRWAWKLTRERAAALLTPALVLLSGGFGWWVFLKEAAAGGRGLFTTLGRLEHDYTIMGHFGYRWGNAVTTLLIPQRGLLLGLPLALVVMTLWWQATGREDGGGAGGGREGEGAAGGDARIGKRKKASRGAAAARERAKASAEPGGAARAAVPPPLSFLPAATGPVRMMIAAGAAAGLLPLVHAHSFVVLMAMGAVLALLAAARGGDATAVDSPPAGLFARWRPWLAFFSVALVLAAPQMFWATRESAVRAGQFFGWAFGWDRGDRNAFWFWIKNTGFFIPLLIAALAWRGRGAVVPARLLYFYLPFALCFVVPNVYKLSPWVWDNIKVLFYWWVASAPLVALLLARLWRRGGAWSALALALLLGQTLAGGLDVWRVATGAAERQVFDRDGMALAGLIRRETPPRSLILHAPTYNDPSYLSGRRTFLGYPGHMWSHGIDYAGREADLKRIYAGGPEAAALIEKNGIEYVVVGPLERAELGKSGGRVNESFFERFTKVGEAGAYRLYKTARP